VAALGYSGAARFRRHFSKGEGDYLVIQEKLFKGMDLEQIYKKAKRANVSTNPITIEVLSFSAFLHLLMALGFCPYVGVAE
jgi:hypothetical protein